MQQSASPIIAMKQLAFILLFGVLIAHSAVGQDFEDIPISPARDEAFFQWTATNSKAKNYRLIAEEADQFEYFGDLPNDAKTARHFWRICFAYSKIGDFEAGVLTYERHLRFLDLISDESMKFNIKSRYAFNLRQSGKYEKALEVYQQLKTFNKTAKDSVRWLLNKAYAYWDWKQFENFERDVALANRISKRTRDKANQLKTLRYLMGLETDIRKDGVRAAGYLAEYNRLAGSSESDYDKIGGEVYRGLVEKLNNKGYQEAKRHFSSALVQAKFANEYFWEWAIYREYGRLHRELNDYEQADAWFNKMLVLAQSRDDFITENKAHAELLETHVASGDVLGMHKAFIPLADRYQLFKYPELTRQYFHHTQRDHWLFYELRLFWNWAGLWLLLGLGVTLLAVIIRLARKKRWLPIVPYQWYRFIPVVGEKWALQAEVVQWPMLKSNTTIRPEAGKTVKSVDEAVAAVALDHELLARALEPYEEQFRLEIALREDTESKFIWATEQIESYQSFHATLPPEFIPPPIADQFTKYSDDQLMAMYNRVKALRKQNWPNWPGNVSNPHPEA